MEIQHTGSASDTVLLCEDDDDVREVMAAVLGIRGHTVLRARNGTEALDLARGHRGKIRLLVTDMAMPGIGGLELATVLRERDPGLRVLFVSGHTEHAERIAAMENPETGTSFLPKPFLPGELTRAVAALL
jgi:CheY-like chemotaxis protein